jgi:DNA-binding MarR family transcriptional regulator
MLAMPQAHQTLIADVRAYLHEVLGAEVRIHQWSGARKVPYYLQDAFELHELMLGEKPILLVSARKERMPLGTLRTQLDKLEQITGHPVVLATRALASYERKRLVQQKVPFVVPGNQLYLPDLGIDFREYFRRPQAAVTAFTPATQALFIAALLRKEWQGAWKPADLVAQLGYTTMTLSRAIRELASAGLLTADQDGRTRRLQVTHLPAQAWEHAKPFLRSPVKRSIWVSAETGADLEQVAGLSAVAFYTMLAEPLHACYATGLAEWKAQQTGIQTLEQAQPDASQWQVWAYAPRLLTQGRAVDPLSLTLSLQDETDERVQQSLEELRERFPW